MLFLLVAYSLSVGNAGTGFRYRTHLVTLAVGAMAILRQHVIEQRAEKQAAAADEASRPAAMATQVPTPA
jgi:hypothetical protein